MCDGCREAPFVLGAGALARLGGVAEEDERQWEAAEAAVEAAGPVSAALDAALAERLAALVMDVCQELIGRRDGSPAALDALEELRACAKATWRTARRVR